MKTISTSKVEAHAKAAARIADGLNAALVGVELDLGVAMATDEPRGHNHAHAKENGGKNLHQQREILPEIRGWIHRPA
jgi:signal transduction histidine kinase